MKNSEAISRRQLEQLAAALAERDLRQARTKINSYFPDTGLLRRELYAKHMEFFKLGATNQEIGFMAGNRTGKSIAGAYEVTLHLTGDYPHWWEGKRFEGPTDWWVAGDTSETTRDVPQTELFGPAGDYGTGMIPHRCIIGAPKMRRGVNDAIDTAMIRHKSGGVSNIGFKSYDQGRKKFQGTKKHGIWLDEEPPSDVYDECLIRLMTTNGLLLITFTPLQGLSEVALRFLPHMAVQTADPVLNQGYEHAVNPELTAPDEAA